MKLTSESMSAMTQARLCPGPQRDLPASSSPSTRRTAARWSDLARIVRHRRAPDSERAAGGRNGAEDRSRIPGPGAEHAAALAAIMVHLPVGSRAFGWLRPGIASSTAGRVHRACSGHAGDRRALGGIGHWRRTSPITWPRSAVAAAAPDLPQAAASTPPSCRPAGNSAATGPPRAHEDGACAATVFTAFPVNTTGAFARVTGQFARADSDRASGQWL